MPVSIIRRLNRGFARIGPVWATLLLSAGAIVLVLASHFGLGALESNPPDAPLLMNAALITVMVGTPIIAWSQALIRTLHASHRTLKQMTTELAVARDQSE